MPKPVYLLCCQSGSDDSKTNLASHFHVYDRIDLVGPSKGRDDQQVIYAHMPLRIVAVWSVDKEDDYDTQFEVQVGLKVPPRKKETIIYRGEFKFERGKPKQRFTFDVLGFNVGAAGDLVVDFRIRKLGESRWLRQGYTIEVYMKPNHGNSSATAQTGEADNDESVHKPKRTQEKAE